MLALLSQIAILSLFYWIVPIQDVLDGIAQFNRFTWLLVLAGFFAYAYCMHKLYTRRTMQIVQFWTYGLHLLVTTLLLIPLFALSTTIDHSIPATAAVLSMVVFGGLAAYAQFGSIEKFRHRSVMFLGCLAVASALILTALNGRGLSEGDWLALAAIVLAAVFVVLDIGNLMCRYRTDEWMRSSMTLYTTFTMFLCGAISLGLLVL